MFSCTNLDMENSGTDKALNEIYRDSILRLDTLVMKYRTIDVNRALSYAETARRLAERTGMPGDLAKAYILLGNAYSLSVRDSAYLFYNRALSLATDFGVKAVREKLFYDLAVLDLFAANYIPGINMLDSSLRLSYLSGNKTMASQALNLMGTIYYDMKDFAASRKFFDSAYAVAARDSLYCEMGEALGNIADASEDDSVCITMLRKAITLVKRGNGPDETVSYVYANIASRSPNPDTAILYANKALEYIRDESSPELVISIYNNAAYAYLDLGRKSIADSLLRMRAIPIAEKYNLLNWLSVLFDSYADILSAEGQISQALMYQRKALTFKEQSAEKSAMEQVRLLSAMLDVKNTQELLKESQRKTRETQQSRNLIAWGAAAVLLVVLLLSNSILQRRRSQFQKIQIEAARKIIEAEETQKSRIGRDFHDLIGHQFLELKNAVESPAEISTDERNHILLLMNDLHSELRNFSHTLSPGWLEKLTLPEALEGLCLDYRRMRSEIIRLNIAEGIGSVTTEIRIQVFRIVQEMLTNASKYAAGATVSIDVKRQKESLNIIYQDNGPGFRVDERRDGTGIYNIFERVKLMRGTIHLDTIPGFGTRYEISIPG